MGFLGFLLSTTHTAKYYQKEIAKNENYIKNAKTQEDREMYERWGEHINKEAEQDRKCRVPFAIVEGFLTICLIGAICLGVKHGFGSGSSGSSNSVSKCQICGTRSTSSSSNICSQCKKNLDYANEWRDSMP